MFGHPECHFCVQRLHDVLETLELKKSLTASKLGTNLTKKNLRIFNAKNYTSITKFLISTSSNYPWKNEFETELGLFKNRVGETSASKVCNTHGAYETTLIPKIFT